MNEAEILSIKIEHSKPLELRRFTDAMLCIERQYRSYLADEDLLADDYTLFIHEVGQGSIIIDFIKGASQKLIEHYVLEAFVQVFGKKIHALIEQKVQDDAGLSLKDLKELHAIAGSIAGDHNSTMSMEARIQSQVTQNFYFTGVQANAVQNECARQISMVDQPDDELLKSVVLYWKQATEEDKSLSIDKGIIEEVDPHKKVKLVCNEALKREMVSANEKNPFNMFFIVDVEVKRVSGKPVAYLIRNIQDKGLIDPGPAFADFAT